MEALFKMIFGIPKAIDDWLEGIGVNTNYIYLPAIIVAFVYLVTRIPLDYEPTLRFMLILLPLFAPFVLFVWFYGVWTAFIYTKFANKQGRVTLEVMVPKEVFKSPEAMEQILMHMYQKAGPSNWVEAFWDGKSPPAFSLEIVSREGAIHLYLNTPRKKFKNLLETHLYAQYPGIEIRELDIDYTAEIPSSLEGYSAFGFHFGRGNPVSPPIRTYVDWGHMDFPKEEEKIDPMATILEAFGSVGPGEHMWLQFLVAPNRKTSFMTGSLKEKPDWKDDMKKVIEKFMDGRKSNELSQYEQTLYQAMVRNLNRYAFNTTMRGIYIAKSEAFNGDRIAALATSMRASDIPGHASIAPSRFNTDVDWPWWQDIGGKTTTEMKKTIVKLYKKRGVRPFNSGDVPTVMTTEELATLWHVPGRTITTPTLGRIESTRREAPSNLPI